MLQQSATTYPDRYTDHLNPAARQNVRNKPNVWHSPNIRQCLNRAWEAPAPLLGDFRHIGVIFQPFRQSNNYSLRLHCS